MTDSLTPLAAAPTTAFAPAAMHSLLNWLDSPPPPSASDELTSLHRQLLKLRAGQATAEQRASMLDRIYTRSLSTITPLFASLTDAALPIPIPRDTRRLVRSAQLLLRTLAESYLASLDDAPPLAGPRQSRAALNLWRALDALAQHLLIGSLVASPAVVGIWRQLHGAYESARRLDLTAISPPGATRSLHDVYYSAVLLGCAQPASFSSREVNLVAAYLASFAGGVGAADESAAPAAATYWIDPAQDATAFACARKSAPPQTPVRYFSCARLAERLGEQLAELEAGAAAAQFKLPDFANTSAGRGVLRRLASYWGEPGKRRFPRRRQNYRAVLCSGLARLWHLFQDGGGALLETSNWMITNESPDGYAFMHVSGKTGGLSVGDITAIRTESGTDWQICIVRWALSENQEHLELGLQILATRAVPARLAFPGPDSDHTLLCVLILPAIRSLRSSERLVIPSGAVENLPSKWLLVVESENIKVREVKCTRLEEQNSKIAIFSIEPDTLRAAGAQPQRN